jgi:putative transposase
MPNYRRPWVTGGTYFFTVITHKRRQVLTTEAVRVALRRAVNQARTTLPFKIDAWVLLPDHLHCVWTLPSQDDNFAAHWAIIKRRVGRECGALVGALPGISRSRRNEQAFWQRRFWEHQIRDDDDLTRHVDYIHWNPVKHGLVKSVRDWPYSTFHRYVAQGIYPNDWGGTHVVDAGGRFGE